MCTCHLMSLVPVCHCNSVNCIPGYHVKLVVCHRSCNQSWSRLAMIPVIENHIAFICNRPFDCSFPCAFRCLVAWGGDTGMCAPYMIVSYVHDQSGCCFRWGCPSNFCPGFVCLMRITSCLGLANSVLASNLWYRYRLAEQSLLFLDKETGCPVGPSFASYPA
jgi:hypothetical protein